MVTLSRLCLMFFFAIPAAAMAGGINLATDSVESVIVTYLWNGYAPKSTRSELLIVHRRDGQWVRRVFLRDGKDVVIRDSLEEDAVRQYLGRIAGAMEAGTPSMGLQTCSNHTDDYPEYDVRILLEGGDKIRLRSSSNCLKTLPWNATDGKQLLAVHDGALPEAIFALIGRKTSRGLGPPPEMLPAGSGEPVTMDVLFAALTNELDRLLVQQNGSGQWVDLQTGHLVAAMAWMDRDDFRARLRKLGDQAQAADRVRRHARGLIDLLAEEPELPEPLP